MVITTFISLERVMRTKTLVDWLELYVTEKGCKDISSNKLLLAASAVAGVGAILVPPPAEAAIVYSGLQELDVANSGSVAVDFDGDAVMDVTFVHSSYPSSSGNYQIMEGPAGDVSFVGSSDMPDRLVKGMLINDNGIVAKSVAVLAGENGIGSSYGNFLGNSGYLGIKFKISSNTHYGWIQYKANANASIGTIIDWAYENTPGKAIETGDTSGEVIEPGDKSSFNWGLFLPAIINGNSKK